jgi:hypothetical protein
MLTVVIRVTRDFSVIDVAMSTTNVLTVQLAWSSIDELGYDESGM